MFPRGPAAAPLSRGWISPGRPAKANGKRDEHAWFTGFAPYNDPEVVVTVYFDLGVGGEKAAPVAGQIFRYFMDHVQP
ncbi:MAG: hypothetical protein DYG91_02720 [Chloroflexi bacterium CFX7]|nr:hypothetical protein [Chloroflexi bacterium CFX7]